MWPTIDTPCSCKSDIDTAAMPSKTTISDPAMTGTELTATPTAKPKTALMPCRFDPPPVTVASPAGRFGQSTSSKSPGFQVPSKAGPSRP